jgi:hypothetical protein
MVSPHHFQRDRTTRYSTLDSSVSLLPEGRPIRKNLMLTFAVIILLFVSILAVTSLDDERLSPLRMHIMGDHVQEASFNETVHYRINIINLRSGESTITLGLSGIPDYWNASLTDDSFTLAPNTNRIVVLSVRAPGEENLGRAGFSRVATIGVRAGEFDNSSIGTTTILDGNTNVTRGGKKSPLYTGYQVNSGDLIHTTGNATIEIDWNNVTGGDYDGSTKLVLDDALVGALKIGGKLYIPIQSGSISFYGEGFGGNGDDIPSGVSVFSGKNDTVSSAFPALDYHSILILEPPTSTDASLSNDSLVTLSTKKLQTVSGARVENLEGEVRIESEEFSDILDRSFITTLYPGEIPHDPETVDRSMIVIDSNGSLDATITTVLEGIPTNILNVNSSRRISVDGKEIYIFDSYLLDVKLELYGKKSGNYTIDFSTIQNNIVRSFILNSTSSLATFDTFKYDVESVSLSDMEQGKTFDIIIQEENLINGQTETFTATEIETLDDDIAFQVVDWEHLSHPAIDPVKVTIGKESRTIPTGLTGEEIMKLFRITQETETTRLWLRLLPIPILAVAGLVGYQYFILAAVLKGLTISNISVIPTEPIAGTPSQFSVTVKNSGEERKGHKHPITVTMYDNFILVGTLSIDIVSVPFEKESERSVTFEWTPDISGSHMMNVSLDVDSTEVDSERLEVQVIDQLSGDH